MAAVVFPAIYAQARAVFQTLRDTSCSCNVARATGFRGFMIFPVFPRRDRWKRSFHITPALLWNERFSFTAASRVMRQRYSVECTRDAARHRRCPTADTVKVKSAVRPLESARELPSAGPPRSVSRARPRICRRAPHSTVATAQQPTPHDPSWRSSPRSTRVCRFACHPA